HLHVGATAGQVDGQRRRHQDSWDAESPGGGAVFTELERAESAAREQPGSGELRGGRADVDGEIEPRVHAIEQVPLLLTELIADEGGEIGIDPGVPDDDPGES